MKVASGYVSNKATPDYIPIARARVYAALSLAQLFACEKNTIAKLVGVNAPSRDVFVSSAERGAHRGTLKWFDPKVLVAVVAAIDVPPPYRPPPGTIEKVLADEAKPAALGTTGPDGYRPPDGTVRRVLADDGDDRPILGAKDYGAPRERREPFQPAPTSKRTLREMLADAVRNTAAMQPKEGEQ